MRKTGPNGLALIRHAEGTVLTVYLDSRGFLTAGTGHLVRYADGPRLGDTISPERAKRPLEDDLGVAEAAVDRCGLDLTQNQFDALVDFAFNEGMGNLRELVQNADGVPAVIAYPPSRTTRAPGASTRAGSGPAGRLKEPWFLTPDDVPMADVLAAFGGWYCMKNESILDGTLKQARP